MLDAYTSSIRVLLSVLLLQGLLMEGVEAGGHEKKGVGHRNNLYKARLSEGELLTSLLSTAVDLEPVS
jgi:hypothetical protein